MHAIASHTTSLTRTPLTTREAITLIETLVALARKSISIEDSYSADAALCAIERAAERALSALDNTCENA